jgi:hypothetical protein
VNGPERRRPRRVRRALRRAPAPNIRSVMETRATQPKWPRSCDRCLRIRRHQGARTDAARPASTASLAGTLRSFIRLENSTVRGGLVTKSLPKVIPVGRYRAYDAKSECYKVRTTRGVLFGSKRLERDDRRRTRRRSEKRDQTGTESSMRERKRTRPALRNEGCMAMGVSWRSFLLFARDPSV